MGVLFDHPFLTLPENEFARAAVERLLASETDVEPAVVFLHGPPGTGKSHLATSLAQRFKETYPEARCRILSIYEFSSLNMESAAANAPHDQLLALSELDLLVCEDVHHLDRQIWLQKKLITVLDELLQAGGRVIFTSQLAVGDFQQAIPKLISRGHAGVTAALALPGEASRVQLLQHFAALQSLIVPEACFERLARELPVSPRELLGITTQLEALTRFENAELTLETIEQFLNGQQPRSKPSLTEIARSVAREFGVTVQSMRSAKREQSLLIPRQVAMLLSRELNEANYATIGAYFGGRSHSTVMHACRALTQKSHVSPELDCRLNQLRRVLQGHSG